MKWDKEAEQKVEMLPIPPMMGAYSRLHAEKVARHRGLDCVTTDVVKVTEQTYADFLGLKLKANKLLSNPATK